MPRIWKYDDLNDDGNDIECVLSDDDIIDRYYDMWKEKMHKAGHADLINKENCIQDFVTINWAWEVEDE